ncbi:UNVERIFIED_CONTAM: hypothetical protein GTU68_000956 [Idotea baltica]|nr:hypothetical protein [Idotea baltica]
MFGSAGGLLEYRAAQLATRGIVALALAFFDYEDLPKLQYQLDLKYFEEAVQVLLRHPKVLKPSVGVIGVSKGGDLALTMATFIPEVAAAVSINGCCSVLATPTKINREHTIKPLLHDISKIKVINKEICVSLGMNNHPEDHPDTIVPIHKSNAKFLFIVGDSDLNMDSKMYASLDAKLLQKVGKGGNCEIHVYKGAGHLIEPPYSSFCPASYHKVIDFVLAWGGELKAHAQAQEEAWIHMLAFLNKQLRTQAKL